MKKLIAILIIFSSCTHQVYVARKGILTEHGVSYIGGPEKVIPNDTTVYTILFQATAFGKYKRAF